MMHGMVSLHPNHGADRDLLSFPVRPPEYHGKAPPVRRLFQELRYVSCIGPEQSQRHI